MTGCLALAEPAAGQTLRKRQSSLIFGGVAVGFAPRKAACMHIAPNSSAFRTPSQGTAGCGSRQRSFPTGGAAYGMPRKTRTEPSDPPTPETKPESSRTGSSKAAEETNHPPNTKIAATQSHAARIDMLLRKTLVPRFGEGYGGRGP